MLDQKTFDYLRRLQELIGLHSVEYRPEKYASGIFIADTGETLYRIATETPDDDNGYLYKYLVFEDLPSREDVQTAIYIEYAKARFGDSMHASALQPFYECILCGKTTHWLSIHSPSLRDKIIALEHRVCCDYPMLDIQSSSKTQNKIPQA